MREDYSSIHLVGFETFMKQVYDSAEADNTQRLEERLSELEATQACVVSASDDSDDLEVKCIRDAVAAKRVSEKIPRVAVVIEDPFYHQSDVNEATRRPLQFYRRHIRRLHNQFHFSIEEENMVFVDPCTFQEYVGFHIFILDFTSQDDKEKRGCFLMIKSCPLEYKSILSDVRRTVRSLEGTTSFKSIVLVADTSKTDGFLRQYSDTIDLDSYKKALDQVKADRLVDDIVEFDGKDSTEVMDLNKRWLGMDANTTHSSIGQHYASTFLGFEHIKNHDLYEDGDVVLQMDSDIIIHAEAGREDAVQECLSKFEDPSVLSFAFPTLSSNPSGSETKHLKDDGITPLRFEIRCSFVHLDRMIQMLPFQIPDRETVNSGECPLKKGWWSNH